jgi:hypothetical protein
MSQTTHILPPPDPGCIATRAIEQHASRQWQRRVAIGSGTGLVAYVWSLGQRKEVAPVHLSPCGLLTGQAVGGHTTTKELRIHKECTGYLHTIHIRQEQHHGDGTDVREHTFLHPLRIWFHSMEDPLPIATRTGTSRKAARHVLPGIELCCLSRAIPPRIIGIGSSHTVERAIIFL